MVSVCGPCVSAVRPNDRPTGTKTTGLVSRRYTGFSADCPRDMNHVAAPGSAAVGPMCHAASGT